MMPDPEEPATGAPAPREVSLAAIARLFLRLGITAVGGPAAHIAMMEHEVVRRRRWLTRQEFLDYLGATNLIPGPNSTELAIHVGQARGGWAGLLVAGISFILPSALIVAALARVYVTYGALPQVTSVLYGVKPVVIAIVVGALWQLGQVALRGSRMAVLGLAALAAFAAGVHELALLAAGGLVMSLWAGGASPLRVAVLAGGSAAAGTSVVAGAVSAAAAAAQGVGLWSLFLGFLRIGSVLFGSGYVLLAYLQADFVDRRGWLTEQQLLDATAVGQMTPGPLFTTATFVGYLLGGSSGAAVATFGIFLPAFVFVALSGPLVPRIRRSARAAAFLDGVNVVSLVLMAAVSWRLARAALVDPLTIALCVVSLAAIARFRVNSLWLLIAGAFVGAASGWAQP